MCCIFYLGINICTKVFNVILNYELPNIHGLILNVLCDHNLVVSSFALTPLTLIRMVSWLFQLLFMFMFKSSMLCHVDNFDLVKLVIFGLIQIWECALNWLQWNRSTNASLTFVTYAFKRATNPKHGFFFFGCCCCCCCSLCANESQLIWKFA